MAGTLPETPHHPTDWQMDDLYSSRRIFFTIDTPQQGRIVAAGRFDEWRRVYAPESCDLPVPDIETFRIVAENDSLAAVEMSYVIYRMWAGEEGDVDPFYYGTLLVFDRL